MNNYETEPLPKGWRWTTLGEVAESMKNGIYKPASAYAEDGFACLRMYNIDGGSIAWRDIKRMRLSEAEIREYELLPGDLLVNRVNSRELVGKTATIPVGMERSVFESKNIRVRLRREIVSPEFVSYRMFFAGSRYFTQNAQQVVGMASISQSQVARFPLPLPPLVEQRRIVAEIEKQLTRLETGVVALQQVHIKLKRYRAAVLNEATKVSWPSMMISEISEVVTGSTPPKAIPEYYGEYLPFIKPGDLNIGYRVKDAKEHLSLEGSRLARILPANTVLVTCIGATIGKSGLARVPCATNQQINSIIPHDHIALPEWIYWMISSPLGQEQIKAKASATTLPILNKGKFLTITLPIPSLAEQIIIIADIERRLSVADALECTIQKTLRRAERLRGSILRAAFSGKV